jgi:Omp85 superfamily domain
MASIQSIRFLVLTCLNVFFINCLWASPIANEVSGTDQTTHPADTTLTSTSSQSATKSSAQKWALVPILMANAETGVQVGALVIRFLNPEDTANKPSTMAFAARISQKKQVEVNFFPEWYLRNNLYHINTDFTFIRWPADFYGIGNGTDIPKDSADPYLAQGIKGELSLERQVFSNLFIGPQALFNYEDIEAKGTPKLLTDTVPGKNGGMANALGAVMTYDRRDAIFWARRGCFLRAKAAWYTDLLASDFNYETYSFEARQYLPLFKTGAIGLAATLKLQDGDVPFRELSTANGDKTMRGMVRGKYRDQNQLILQSEFRSYLPNWSFISHRWIQNRLGYAVFAEVGQVAHNPMDFAWEEFKPCFGFGIRYAMNPAQKMNIRVDIGFVDGGIAPAINIKEAF